jgi:hypothetical protein
MIGRRPHLEARFGRNAERRRAARRRRMARPTDPAPTAQDGLLRAVENGTFETLVGEAQPAQPIAMVTPEEREAELRATSQRPGEKPPLEPAPEPATPPEPERELTPNAQYIAEYCHWRQRGPSDYADFQHEPGRCLVDYDPIEYFYAEQEELEREDEEW